MTPDIETLIAALTIQLGAAEAELQRLRAEVRVTEALLAERQRVLDAVPACDVCGPCVPHAVEWINQSKRLRDGLAALEQEMQMTTLRARPEGSLAFVYDWRRKLAALREGQ